MGPPSRPVENKSIDPKDMVDVLHNVGINLREEEEALFRSSSGNDSSSQPSSGLDQLRQAGGTAPYPFSRDNHYASNTPGGKDSFYGAGTFNQATASKAYTTEELAEIEERKATRRAGEIRQYHLNNPFLLGGTLDKRLRAEAVKNHVHLPIKQDDVLRPQRPVLAPQNLTVHGPDGHSVVKVVQGEPVLKMDNKLVDIIALLSLATEERVRYFVEDAATLAHGRRTMGTGLVPEGMKELAVGQGDNSEVAGSASKDGATTSPLGKNSLKREFAIFTLPLHPDTSPYAFILT